MSVARVLGISRCERMTVKNHGLIDSYCAYFEKQLRVIFALPDVMYRKVLIVIVLDTLARARLPQLKARNHDRFITFVKACGDWRDAGRVSPPQLMAHLNRNPKTAKRRLAQEASARLSNWQVGEMYPINVDPELNELIKLVKDPYSFYEFGSVWRSAVGKV